MFATDICTCGHGIEVHTPVDNYGRRSDFCHGRPGANHPFGDRAIGPAGPCSCDRFISAPVSRQAAAQGKSEP